MSGPALALVGVSKRYGMVQAVKNVSLELPEGQSLGLVGPNGAGKTTTFSMLAGYVRPSEGEVRVFGEKPSARSLKRCVGVLPQDAQLPSFPLGDLMTFFARLSGLERPAAAAEAVIRRVGLEASWDANAQALSHGMQKRASLAQALLGNPPLLLLDEPTAGLDPVSAAAVRSLIAERRGVQTVVVSSHNLTELETLCDTIAILDRGTLLRHDSVQALTQTADELRVQLAPGALALPLPALRALPNVIEVSLEGPATTLRVRYRAEAWKPEEAVGAVMQTLMASNVGVLGVTRGHKLEDAVLEAAAVKPPQS